LQRISEAKRTTAALGFPIRVLFAVAVVALCPVAVSADTFLDASFDVDDNGFVYNDDTFYATASPNYASGSYLPAGGEVGGGLEVLLGNLDDNTINGMSGGHTRSFTLAVDTDVLLEFRYNLTQHSDYESDEYSQVLVSIDSIPLAGLGPEYVDQVTGDGNGGLPVTTGWVTYSINLPSMAAGTYSLTIGGYNNRKTATNELTTLLIDEVSITGSPTIPCLLPADCDDSNVCTDNVCTAGICTNPNNTASCSDGISCTADVCSAGVCVGADQCLNPAICNPVSDTCEQSAPLALVAALSFQNYKDYIEDLSSPTGVTGGSRHWTQPGNAAALTYLQTSLESWGYTVERHTYTFEGQSRDNVYATKVGSVTPEEAIIVSAHMDSINADDRTNVFAPGADDDASGTAVVLEAARVFGDPSIVTDKSIRFIFFNNEETGPDGSVEYITDRSALQGIENPVGSGLYPEPTWLGIIQHDMMLWDHGLPSQPTQIAGADNDIEYLGNASYHIESLALANIVWQANVDYAPAYPAEITSRMCCTDSNSFLNECPAISVRENRRSVEIEQGSNPNFHRSTDVFSTYSDLDFALGFNAVQATVGAVAIIVNAQQPTPCGDGVLDAGEQCDDGNLLAGDCCSPFCAIEPAGTSCRSAVDVCDAPEVCDGVAGTCAVDAKRTTECRVSAGDCDIADFCDGLADACPADAIEPNTTLCRGVAGVCDVPETCDGTTTSCPVDLKLTNACRPSAGICDVVDDCDGIGNDCPVDQFQSPATECRAAVDDCDVPELCSGSSADCPADVLLDGTVCEDGDACSMLDLCAGGTCTPGITMLDCDDLDECTADSCDSITGCAHEPIQDCPAVVAVPTFTARARIVLVVLIAMFAQAAISVRGIGKAERRAP
jgi:cysteine-rich repeat protein